MFHSQLPLLLLLLLLLLAPVPLPFLLRDLGVSSRCIHIYISYLVIWKSPIYLCFSHDACLPTWSALPSSGIAGET